MNKNLQTLLETQKELEYTFENVDKMDLARTLIDDIGNPDSYIRDDLIYPNLAHLLHDKHFDEAELTSLLDLLIDESHLFFDLENKIPNSVLIRSFSILQLVIILFVHKRDKIISERKIQELFEKFLMYLEKETHYEGYNKQVGFLHSIAHSADLLHQFMTIEYFGRIELELMFNAIVKKFKISTYYYQHDEDERMVKAITEGLKRNILTDTFLYKWLDELSTYEKSNDYPDMYFVTNNIKILLRSLYFAIIDEKELDELTAKIKEVLKNKITLR